MSTVYRLLSFTHRLWGSFLSAHTQTLHLDISNAQFCILTRPVMITLSCLEAKAQHLLGGMANKF